MEQFHNSARNSSQSQSNQNLMLVYLPCLMPVGPLVGHIPQQLNSPTQAPVSDQAAMSSELLPLIKEEYQSTDKPFESTVKKEPELDDLNQDTTPIVRHYQWLLAGAYRPEEPFICSRTHNSDSAQKPDQKNSEAFRQSDKRQLQPKLQQKCVPEYGSAHN
jgi:hypothetical protein